MGDVLTFGEKTPHIEGAARCLLCKHEWRAVMPTGSPPFFECPECKTEQGVFIGTVVKDRHHWTCTCGNQLFHVTPEGVYCPLCGGDQNFDKALGA